MLPFTGHTIVLKMHTTVCQARSNKGRKSVYFHTTVSIIHTVVCMQMPWNHLSKQIVCTRPCGYYTRSCNN